MTTQKEYAELLKQHIKQLEDSAQWLKRSHLLCADVIIDNKHLCPPETCDALEALTSRFARLADILLQKMFRCIDIVEMTDGGTLLDALNRAEKRRLIPSTDWFRVIREIRNEIAHEYASDNLSELYKAVIENSPALLATAESTVNYANKLHSIIHPDTLNHISY